MSLINNRNRTQAVAPTRFGSSLMADPFSDQSMQPANLFSMMNRMTDPLNDFPALSNADRLDSPLDCWETPEAWMVEVAVPGFKHNEMEIQLRGKTLRIIGHHEEVESEGGDRTMFRAERKSKRRFDKSVRVPDEIDVSKITAKLVHGYLDVTLPKSGASLTPSSKIEIDSE